MFIKILKTLLPTLGIILAWMLITPIFEFPDEQAHFGTVSYLLDQNRLPSGNDLDMTREMYSTQELLGVLRDGYGNNKYTYHPEYHVPYTDSIVGQYEEEIKSLNNQNDRNTYVGKEAARYPVLYYRLIGLFTTLVNKQDIITRVFVTRLGGLFIAFGLGYFSWKVGLLLFGKTKLANTLVALTLLQPMMSFVTAGINSDNLHNLLFLILIYLGLDTIKNGIKLKHFFFLPLALALDIYTKPQGFIAIPIIGISLLISIIRHHKWWMLVALLVLGLLVLVIAPNQLNLYSGLLTVSNFRGVSLIEFLRFSSNKLLAQNVVWYWGVFKWLGVVLPSIYWQIANRVVLLAVIGLANYMYKAVKHKKLITDPLNVIYLVLVSAIYTTTIFWYDWQHLKIEGFSLGIQARYFFPTIVAHLSLLIIGITSIGWNKKIAEWLRRTLLLLFLWLQLGGIWRLISIYYDTSSISTMITELSQYKPYFVKGSWIYLWAIIYVSSLLAIAYTNFKKSPPIHNSTRASSGK